MGFHNNFYANIIYNFFAIEFMRIVNIISETEFYTHYPPAHVAVEHFL